MSRQTQIILGDLKNQDTVNHLRYKTIPLKSVGPLCVCVCVCVCVLIFHFEIEM